MVTPSKIPSYVQSALLILHQSRVMERFGMFFVDDLDLDDMERINVNLGDQDGVEIKRDQKAALATRFPQKTYEPRGIQLTEPHRTEEYPWGETILWRTLQKLLKQHPVDFLRPFDFHQVDIGLGTSDYVESLFNDFTRDTWLCIHESFVPAGVLPRPTRLKDSMEVWTCQNIAALLGGKCIFLPSTHDLQGAPKSKGSDPSFKALRTLFFPAPGQTLKENTVWAGYSKKDGYIQKYWDILQLFEDDRDGMDALHDGIDRIFEQLQCLPQSKANSNLWHATDGSVCFLTNPCYYRIKAISTTARKLKLGPQRPQVSMAELRKRLDPFNAVGKRQKRSLNRKRSIKHKNYRQPPKKRQRMDGEFQARNKQTAATERQTKGNTYRAADQLEGRNSDSETDDFLSSEMDGGSETADSLSTKADSNWTQSTESGG